MPKVTGFIGRVISRLGGFTSRFDFNLYHSNRRLQLNADMVAQQVLERIMPWLEQEFRRFHTEALDRLNAELTVMRLELQADRGSFVHGLEQLRQSQEQRLLHELQQSRETGVAKLAETLDAALLTLALNSHGANYRSSSVNSEST